MPQITADKTEYNSVVMVILVTVLLLLQGPIRVQALVPDYCVQRVGCFLDRAPVRDLEIEHSYIDTSPWSCRDMCKSQYLFAGTQNGDHCFCGDNLGTYGHEVDNCIQGMMCRGYPDYRCGHGYVNDVFLTTKSRQEIHLGCFNNDMTETISTGGVNVDPLRCAVSCRKQGYLFAGLQDGTNCLCGNTYGSAGAAATCNSPCLTEGATYCGGSSAISVYLTGKDDFWQSASIAHDVYSPLPMHLLLDDSEETCINIADIDSKADFTFKFSTTAYYQHSTPGITMLVTMENLSCPTDNVLVYVDKGAAHPGFHGEFKKCSLFETLADGLMNTCVFKCPCVDSSCKEVFVRFLKSHLSPSARLCEIRSCYTV